MQHLVESLGQFYDRYGYAFVVIGSFLENISLTGIILPGGALAFIGAFYARQGTLQLPAVMLFAIIGALLGCHVDYALGRWALGTGLHAWEKTWWGKRFHVQERMANTTVILARYGGVALFLGPFLGVFRSFIILGAGAMTMPYAKFIRWTAPAVILWNSIWCLLGYWCGAEYDLIQRIITGLGWSIVGLIVGVGIAWWLGGARLRHWLNSILHLPEAL